MAYGGRYPMGTGWQAGVQTRYSLGIVYRYSSYLPAGPGRRGYSGNGRSVSSSPRASIPTRVNIRGGRSR